MVSPAPLTRPDRERLPRTEVEGRFTETLSELSVPAEATAVRAPSGGWVMDGASQIAEPEFGARYRMRDQLGRGGMGDIRLARDLRIGRDVAAKFLHEAHASDPHLRKRFVREACLQGQLEHPSIVPVHDLG